jgi:hypothetical protein
LTLSAAPHRWIRRRIKKFLLAVIARFENVLFCFGERSSCCHCAIRERSSFFFLENVLLAVIARFENVLLFFFWRTFFLLSLRDSGLSRRGCRPCLYLRLRPCLYLRLRPCLLEANDPSVRLRPRPNPLFCLSFRVWGMFYSMISSTMCSTQKTCLFQ